MSADLILRVRQQGGGWVVEGAAWTSELLSRDAAFRLAHGMAKVIASAGQETQVRMVHADGREEPCPPN